VTIRAHTASEAPVAGVSVTGSWSGGTNGSATCTTDATGACSVTTGNVQNRRASVTFTVSSLSGSGFTYAAGANHDPDGESNGTSITVLKP
jgi:hypothetical protein